MILETSFEKDGYDGIRGDIKWWFESWGNGSKEEWKQRKEEGKPPTPADLRHSDYITIGLRFPNGEVEYRTRKSGLDV